MGAQALVETPPVVVEKPGPGARVQTDTGAFALVPLWLIESGPAMAVKLYALLGARYADRSGVAFPGRKTLADQMVTSVDTVDRALKWLEEHGALTVEARRRPDGSYSSNLYTLHLVGGSRTHAATLAAPARPPSRTHAATSTHTQGTRDPVLRQDAVNGAEKNPDVRTYLQWFDRTYPVHRNGARYFVNWAKDAARVRLLLKVWPLTRLKQLAVVLWTTDEEWVSTTDRGVGILQARATWLDDILSEHEKAHGPAEIPT